MESRRNGPQLSSRHDDDDESARNIGERWLLPKRGSGQSPGRKRIFTHFGLSKRISWQHF